MMSKHDDSPSDRKRVNDKIIKHVMLFSNRSLLSGGKFHMSDLTAYVSKHVEIAPDSPGRILRMLKKNGVLDYEVTNRSASEYRILRIGNK